MSDVNKLLEAFAALAQALPGSPRSTNVHLHGCPEITLRVLVEAGGLLQHYKNESCTEEWDCAEIGVSGVTICAWGPHRPLTPVCIDSSAVDAAVKQAREAVAL
jgi:hypothetical protein